jgi:hypothetical protein
MMGSIVKVIPGFMILASLFPVISSFQRDIKSKAKQSKAKQTKKKTKKQWLVTCVIYLWWFMKVATNAMTTKVTVDTVTFFLCIRTAPKNRGEMVNRLRREEKKRRKKEKHTHKMVFPMTLKGFPGLQALIPSSRHSFVTTTRSFPF